MGLAGATVAGLMLSIEAGCVVTVATLTALWVCRGSGDLLDRAVVGLLTAAAMVVGILQLAGMVDLLERGPVFAMHLVVTVVAVALVPRADPRASRYRASIPALLVAAPAVFFGFLGTLIGLSGRSLEADTVQYHVPNTVYWLQTHTLWHLPVTLPGYFTNAYPSNGELTSLWLMLPSHGDQLAYVPPIAFGVLAVLAGGLLARELGGPAWVGALAGLAVALTPACWGTQVHSVETDLTAYAGVVAGAAFMLRAARSPGELRWAVFSGVALGLGAGSKDTALAPTLGVLVLGLCLLPRSRWTKELGATVAGVVAFAGLWWVRNTVVVGNPIYPQGLGIAGHHLLPGAVSGLSQYSTSLLSHLVAGHLTIMRRWFSLGRILIGTAAILGALGVVAGSVGRRGEGHRARLLVAGLTAASFVAYLATPYTGGGTQGLAYLISSQLRYALPTLALGAGLAAAATPRLSGLVAAVAVVLGGWKDVHAAPFRVDVTPTSHELILSVVATVVVLGGVGAWRITARAPRSVWVAGSALAVVAVALAATAAYRETKFGPFRIDSLTGSNSRVMVAGITDVGSLLGAKLGHHLETPGPKVPLAGNQDLFAPAALDAQVRRDKPAVIVIGHLGLSPVPTSWQPPGYLAVGSLADGTLYLPAGSGASPGTANR
jgi:hypothetical protein